MAAKAPYDINERTFQFAVRVVKLTDALSRRVAADVLGKQLIAAATSVGANVEEAQGAESRRDAAHKFGISRKEARESRYWLRLIRATGLVSADCDEEALALIQESDEIRRILSSIVKNIQGGMAASKETEGEYLIYDTEEN